MGSKSDWDTMRQADEMLTRFDVPHESRVMSAHRTPALDGRVRVDRGGARARGHHCRRRWRGASGRRGRRPHGVPVIGVPMQSALNGLDSLLSTVQMPKGVPVATVAIGASGAANAGLLAVAILATSRPELRAKLLAYRDEMADEIGRTSLT